MICAMTTFPSDPLNLTGKYILDRTTKLPLPCFDLLQWATWFEDPANRRVAVDERDGWRVSTIFLALDHNFIRPYGSSDVDPILFETMVFAPDGEQGQWRYRTWAEAAAGHEKVRSILWKELDASRALTMKTLLRVARGLPADPRKRRRLLRKEALRLRQAGLPEQARAHAKEARYA
jgi:hypothetical protein